MKFPFSFKRSYRLTCKKDFERMYESKLKRSTGPFLIHRRPNTLGHARLGISVPKRVGNAVQRNRVKRLCREAFRLSFPNLPSIDILITVRPHKKMTLNECIEHIQKGTE